MNMHDLCTTYGLYDKPLALRILCWASGNIGKPLRHTDFNVSRQTFRTNVKHLLKNGLLTSNQPATNQQPTIAGTVFMRVDEQVPTNSQPATNQQLTSKPSPIYKTGAQAVSYAHYLDSKQKKKTTKKEKNPSQPISALKRQYETEFDNDFWPLCQRKVGKAHCRKAYVSLRTNNRTELTATELVDLYNRHVMQAREVQFSKHPSTWLNAECWDDQEAQVKTEDSYEKVTTPLLNPEYDSTEDKLARIWPDWKVDFARWVPSVFPEMADPKLWEDYAYTMYWEARNKNGGVKLV